MKKTPITSRCLSNLGRASVLSLAIATFQTAQGATLYWDVNGTADGSGGTITGAWNGTNTYWNTDSTGGAGGGLVAVTNSTDSLVFSAGTDAVPGTVTLAGTQYAQGIRFTTGGYSLGGGSAAKLYLGSGGLTVDGGGSATNITTQIVYTASQTWTNNSTGLISFQTAIVADSSITTPFVLTLAGTGGYATQSSGQVFLKDNSATGIASLVYNANGQFEIKSANAYSGGTTFKKGSFRLNNVAALGTGAITFDVRDGGTAMLNTIVTGTMANNIVVMDGGTGTAIISTVNGSNPITYSGTISLNNTGSSSGLNIVGNASAVITVTGKITGTGGLTKSGTSTLVLGNAANDYQGGTTMNGATSILQLNADGALGAGTLTLNAGTIRSDANSRTIANALGTIGGNITFGSTTAGNTGALNFTNATAAALAASTATTRTFTVNSDTTFANGFAGTATNASAASGFTKAGTATMIMGGDSTYTGLTTVSAGTLQVGDGDSGSIASTSGTVAAGATLAFKQADGSSYSGAIANSGTVKGLATGTNTLSGAISGTGGFSQEGPGATVLTGTSNYTGATNVTAGTLIVGTSGVLGNTAVTVAGEAGLKVNGTIGGSVNASGIVSGTGSIGGATVISGTLAPGNSIGTISTGDLSFAGGVLDIEFGRNGAVVTSDQVSVTGLVDLTGGDLHLALGSGTTMPLSGDILFLISNDGSDAIVGHFAKLDGSIATLTEGSTFTWNSQLWEITYTADASSQTLGTGNDLALIAVPEPGTWAMLVSGIGMLVGAQRLRRNRFNS
ncbi:MAG: autotransporter-associated beta strand repeat-containing protein [Chthoniobacteraceae bacterium]|nr:autotransporter-associated beta strand repeat-containing protein [Chthoniobacteraceae bacterium]